MLFSEARASSGWALLCLAVAASPATLTSWMQVEIYLVLCSGPKTLQLPAWQKPTSCEQHLPFVGGMSVLPPLE